MRYWEVAGSVVVSLFYVVVTLHMIHKYNKGLEAGRKLRLIKFYNQQDYMAPFGDWPNWARVSALNREKTNHQRFQFFQFLWRNGLQPHWCGEWTRLLDWQHKKCFYLQDPKIIKHIGQMIGQARPGTAMAKGRVYDCMARRPL